MSISLSVRLSIRSSVLFCMSICLLCVYLCVSLSIRPSVHLSVRCLSVCLSVCLFVCLRVGPSVCLCVHVSTCPSGSQGVCRTVCMPLSVYLSVCLLACPFVFYFSLCDVHSAGWPLTPWQWGLESLPPRHGVSVPLQPDLPVLRSVPHNCAFVTDGPWFPSHCCGGAFAVVCLDTLTWVVYPVSVPCHLAHSYAVEVYTPWVLCRVRHTLLASGTAACATARSLRKGGSFTDSGSYIQALSSRRPAELG